MLADRFGLSLSTSSAAARDAYVDASERALTFYPGALDRVVGDSVSVAETDSPDAWPYGRGSRESVRRRARAVTESPISVSSATAWIAVPMISGRLGAGGTGARG